MLDPVELVCVNSTVGRLPVPMPPCRLLHVAWVCGRQRSTRLSRSRAWSPLSPGWPERAASGRHRRHRSRPPARPLRGATRHAAARTFLTVCRGGGARFLLLGPGLDPSAGIKLLCCRNTSCKTCQQATRTRFCTAACHLVLECWHGMRTNSHGGDSGDFASCCSLAAVSKKLFRCTALIARGAIARRAIRLNPFGQTGPARIPSAVVPLKSVRFLLSDNS